MNRTEKEEKEQSVIKRVRLDQEPVEFLDKQNPESGENIESFADVVLNFALVFRTDLANFIRIRRYLLDSRAVLLYQTKSVQRITIQRRNEKTCIDCIAWSGRCGRGIVNRVANSEACQDFQQRVTGYEKTRGQGKP